jgi:hypothetical protein
MWATVSGPNIYLHINVQDELDRIIVESAIQMAAKAVQSADAGKGGA